MTPKRSRTAPAFPALASAVAAAFCFAALALAAEGPPLVIKGGWVRAEAAGARSLEAFMVIENNSLMPQSIVLVEADDFAHVEIQRTAPGRGAATSTPVEQIDIPMFGRRALEPHGEFLRLSGPKRAFRAGDTITITFQLADGKLQKVVLPVRRNPEE